MDFFEFLSFFISAITIYNESRKMHFSRIASKIILLPSTEKTAEQLDVVKFIEVSIKIMVVIITHVW